MKTVLFGSIFFGLCNLGAQTYWQKHPENTASVIITDASKNEKFATKSAAVFVDFEQPKETDVCVFVSPNKKYQKLIGIGGAITDAAAETYYKLPKDKQEEFINAYYSKKGLGYTIVRTNMNSCDFSTNSYTYVKDEDTSLKSFDISHDEKFKIPLIKEAQRKIGKDFTFYFSPWSPPAWMKDNRDMLHGGRLLEKYYPTWANYYVKFIQEYEKRGLPVWGLTVQNEPMAKQTWESCIYTAQEEADFLRKSLGPALWKNGYKNKKVMIWDHNRDLLYQRATTTLADPEVAKYSSGIAFHWYETWTKSAPLFDNVAETQKAFPNMFLAFSEGCKELFNFNEINDVSLGELYGRNMIHDFNNGTALWTDWNVLLDETGGPNHAGNFCYAPIIADTRTGELHYTYEYYYIGHVSQYVRKNAQRVGTATNRDFLLATSFLNTDGKLSIIVMNEGDNDTIFNLYIEGKAAKLPAPAHSIQTIIL